MAPVYPAESRRNSWRAETSLPVEPEERVRDMSAHVAASEMLGMKSANVAAKRMRRVTSLLYPVFSLIGRVPTKMLLRRYLDEVYVVHICSWIASPPLAKKAHDIGT